MSTRTQNLQDLFATSALTQRMIHACMQHAFEEVGIAPSQMHLLQLVEHSQPVSLKKLADDMRLTPGAITQLVDGLVATEYLQRTSSKEDRRVIVVTLTDIGKEKIGFLKRKKQALLAQVAAELNDDELEVFLRVQQKMLRFLETNCRNIKK